MVSRIGTILVQWQQCAGGRALTSSCVAPGVREQSVGRAAPVPYQVLPLSCVGHRHWNVCFLQPSQGWPPPLGAENKRKRGEECCGHKRNNISGLSWDFLTPPVLVVRLGRMLFNQTFSVVCEDFLKHFPFLISDMWLQAWECFIAWELWCVVSCVPGSPQGWNWQIGPLQAARSCCNAVLTSCLLSNTCLLPVCAF